MSSKEKEFEFEDVNYVAKRPTSKVSQEAQRIYAAEFMKSIESGLMTKEKLKRFLTENGVWTEKQEEEEKEISENIARLELEIYQGGSSGKRLKLSEGKEKAIEIKELRGKYVRLISERQSYEANTAESMADNARFDFLVSQCIFKQDGSKVYNSYEDYLEKSDEELGYYAASNLAELLYAMEGDFEKKLPENQFLLRFGLVDEELRLVNSDGKLVDREGRLINEEGFYIDSEGNRIDKNGNSLTEDGLLTLDVVYTDDDGNEILPKSTESESEDPETEDEAEPVEEDLAVPVPEEEAKGIEEIKDKSNG